jgi:hypothetical protein
VNKMKLWKTIVIGGAAALVLGVGANFVAVAAGSDSPAGVVDISGPCDEAEHANDPECAGVTVPGTQQRGNVGRVDISGPCDEAEHANDPRCTGAGVDEERDDNSGPSGNSGPSENSGPGNSGDDGDDNSGPGSGDDDNSGPGSGDDDNSGPGSGDDH